MTDNYHADRKGMHLGIIPDGNRRYAIKNRLKPWKGHREGAKRLKEVLEWCMDYPSIKEVSVFALSTDNLSRPVREVKELWDIYLKELGKLAKDRLIRDNKIKVRVLGDNELWPDGLEGLVKNILKETGRYTKRILNLMLAYSTRFEIARAFRLNSIGKMLVKRPLDLVIRTGGQYRLSGFMAIQAQYAEIYFTKTLFPEFTKTEFRNIMDWYDKQVKKFGR